MAFPNTLTIAEIAKYCNVSRQVVLKWIEAGTLRTRKTPGGCRYIDLDKFMEFIERERIPLLEDFYIQGGLKKW